MKTRPGTFVILALSALLAAVSVRVDAGDGRFERRFGDRDDDATRAERMERWREHRRNDSGFGRLSPEERQQLRHDIRAAREGVYRRPPPPPPLPPGLQEGRPASR
jgi:hypothetical protein